MPIKYPTVEEEYGKNVDLRKSDVEYIQTWLEKQPHLPNISEIELIYFMHSCYYSVEKTKETIDKFFTIKTACPEFFGKTDPEKFRIAVNESVYAPLPKLTPEGYQVVLIKLLNCNPNTYSFANHMKYAGTFMHLWLAERGTVNGLIIVVDMSGFMLGHVTKVPISSLKKSFVFLQEGLPVRLKGIHCINTVPFIDTVMTLVKPLLKAELLNILYFHSKNNDTLYKHVPLECLPSDYGGNADSLEEFHKSLLQILLCNVDVIEENEKRLVDESKRPDKTKNADSLFGIEGTFKKLEID